MNPSKLLRMAKQEVQLGIRRKASLAMGDQGRPWDSQEWRDAYTCLREAFGIQTGLPWYEREVRPSKQEVLAAFDRAIALAEAEE